MSDNDLNFGILVEQPGAHQTQAHGSPSLRQNPTASRSARDGPRKRWRRLGSDRADADKTARRAARPPPRTAGIAAGRNRSRYRAVPTWEKPLTSAPLNFRSRTQRCNSAAAACGSCIGSAASAAKRSGRLATASARASLALRANSIALAASGISWMAVGVERNHGASRCRSHPFRQGADREQIEQLALNAGPIGSCRNSAPHLAAVSPMAKCSSTAILPCICAFPSGIFLEQIALTRASAAPSTRLGRLAAGLRRPGRIVGARTDAAVGKLDVDRHAGGDRRGRAQRPARRRRAPAQSRAPARRDRRTPRAIGRRARSAPAARRYRLRDGARRARGEARRPARGRGHAGAIARRCSRPRLARSRCAIAP